MYNSNTIMTLETAVKVAQIASYLIGSTAAIWAALVYRENARRERAKWAESLFNLFYIKTDLKRVRNLIDCELDNKTVEELVESDAPEWTDYLNFFEFVEYLKVSKQLSEKDVQALFGYYLLCLNRHRVIIEYIEKDENGFDYLKNFLKR
jgi:hypothetical protein